MTDETKPFHNPFGVLSELRGRLPDQPSPPSSDTPSRSDPKTSARAIPRAVVRLERSGRGGKEVTIVEHLSLQTSERESWLKTLKAALGCGGHLEGDALIFQGDQRDRLPALLGARGVKKITLG